MTLLPKVKLKAAVNFPASVLDGTGIDVTRSNGTYQFNLAFDDFAPPVSTLSDPGHQNALVWNSTTAAYALVPIALLATGGAGVIEAPNDGTLYGRKNLGWTPVPAAGIADAPNDGTAYNRKSLGWVAVTADAPSDSVLYGRRNGAWTAVNTEAALLYIPAWEHGVLGDSTDQTAALQAIINGLPAQGGNIALRGTVIITSITLAGKRNIRFIGQSSNGAGAAQLTTIQTNAGAAAGTVINLTDTVNVSFERLYFYAPSTSFDGTFLNYAASSTGCAYNSLVECFLQSNGSSSVMLNLSGQTTGSFEKCTFAGRGILVSLQRTAGLCYCNVNSFRRCNFTPYNQYPIEGSGEAILFDNCNWQAGTNDGVGRGFRSSSLLLFRGLTFIGCAFYDATLAGGEWIVASWGRALDVIGCRFGGIAGSYGIDIGGVAAGDPQEGGVLGVNISGNTFDTFAAAITFSGTIAAKSSPRGIVIGGNHVKVGSLLANYAVAEQMVLLPNSIYSAPLQLGAHMAFLGLPAYADRATAVAAGLTTGQLYQTTATDHVIQIV